MEFPRKIKRAALLAVVCVCFADRATAQTIGAACVAPAIAGSSALINSSSTAELLICNGSTWGLVEAMTTGGNVGIGTTSPDSALVAVNSGSGAITQVLALKNNNGSVVAGQGGKLAFLDDSGASSGGGSNWIESSEAASTAAGTLMFGGWSGSSEQEWMRITPSGNVGIGTASPQGTLDVASPANLASSSGAQIRAIATASSPYGAGMRIDSTAISGGHNWLLFAAGGSAGEALGSLDIKDTTAGLDRMTILSNGNVGIGTTSPASLLHIGTFNKTSDTSIILDTQAANLSGINFYSAGGQASLLYRPASSTDLRIYSNSLSKDVVTFQMSSGNVGIGTATPKATLDVNGYGKLAINASAPVTCDASHEGAFAYTGTTTHYLCFCDATSWKQAHSPSTACTW